MKVRVIFLDRDGVINTDIGAVFRREQWRFTRGAPHAIRRLGERGYRIAVVTNQAGVGNGLFAEKDVQSLHEYMQNALARHHARIDAIAYCPHKADDHCSCRKPRTGMVFSICRQLGARIDFRRSWVIGDKVSDVLFGKALGARTALVHSRYWQRDELTCLPDLIGVDLHLVASQILQSESEASAKMNSKISI